MNHTISIENDTKFVGLFIYFDLENNLISFSQGKRNI